MSIYAIHDSFNTAFRLPFGAMAVGKSVQLSLFLNEKARVWLLVWQNGNKSRFDMQAADSCFDSIEGYMYSACLTMPDSPGLLFYCFEIEAADKTLYYCGRHGQGELCENIACSYQITVYVPHSLPARCNNTVMYQIFPDRFARSQPCGGLLRVDSHTNKGREIFIHTDWDDDVNSTPLPHQRHYTPNDFFCGDLLGIEENLDYLKSLFVSCIYLNPVFESPSNHRYDTSDYLSIDGILGGDEAYFSLKQKCSENGINIMLDGVFSHTGSDSIYFNKYGRYNSCGAYQSEQSPYFEWYDFKKFPGEYASWWGFDSLPEVNEDNKSFREFIKKVVEKWDCSWRLDVADELTDDFIRFFIAEVKKQNKNNIVVGEVWEDASDKFSKNMRRGYTNGDVLDGVMNYPLRQSILDFLCEKTTAYDLAYFLNSQKENYPPEFLSATMNILSTHDTERVITALSKASNYKNLSDIDGKSAVFCDKRLTNWEKKVILAVIVQFAALGTPCIYYGDETGMQGERDPFCRRTFKRNVSENHQILDVHRKLAKARATHSSFLGTASYTAYCNDILIIERISGSANSFFVINRLAQEANVTIEVKSGKCFFTDVLSGNGYCTKNNTLKITLAGQGGAALCSTD